MKKILFLILFLLVGCAEEEIDIRKEIATKLTDVASFQVEEQFEFTQYGRNNDTPHNRIISINNLIEYDDNLVHTINSMQEQTIFQGAETSINRSFESYRDWLSQIGYVRDEFDTWHKVELTHMYKMGLSTIDPIAIVNMILYENKSFNYVYSDTEANQYEYVIAKISREMFEEMFSASIFSFISMDYDYDVEVALKFDENYFVERIDFDITEFRDRYLDYAVYETGSVITSSSSSLSLEFSNYDKIQAVFDDDSDNWIMNSTYEISNEEESYSSEYSFGKVTTDVKYESSKSAYDVNLSLLLNSNLKYFYYEVYFYAEDELIHSAYSESYNELAFVDIPLYYIETEKKIDEVLFCIRYVSNNSSVIKIDYAIADIDYDEPVHGVELDIRDFDDSPRVVVPKVFVEQTDFVDDLAVYDIQFHMYATQKVRHTNCTFYVYKDGLLIDVFYKNSITIEEGEDYSIFEKLDYIPDTVYIDIEYYTSYLEGSRTQIEAIPYVFEGDIGVHNFVDGDKIDVSITEIQDIQWYAYKYLINIVIQEEYEDLNAILYFMTDDYLIVGWEYLYDISSDELIMYVSELYDDNIDIVLADIYYREGQFYNEKISIEVS